MGGGLAYYCYYYYYYYYYLDSPDPWFVSSFFPSQVTWGGYANPVVFNPERRLEGSWRETLTFGHPNEFVMAYAGRISPEKDIGFLVALVKRFRDEGHGVWLALIGDGPATEEFRPLHGDPAHGVWFVPGFLPQRELAQVYASVDCVASASTFETFGFTALEVGDWLASR